jgi:membrane associated rhomboid family serine protease
VEGPQGGVLTLPYRWQWRWERWKNNLRGFIGGGEKQQPRPKLCPSCGTLVGIHATKCHVCGTNLRFSLAALSKSLSISFGERAPVTTALLVANLLMFGVTYLAMIAEHQAGGLRILWGMSNEALFRLGASNPYSIFYLHQWWRLITAMFLHGGLIHIGFNLMVLWDFGPPLEELYGSAKFFFFYIACGAFGYVVSAFLGHFSIGASGAILGLVGLLLAVTTKRGGAHMRQLRSHLVGWLVFLFVLGFVMPVIDNSAHLGGLALGFAFGKLTPDRQPTTPGEKKLTQTLAFITAIVVVASFALMFIHYRDPLPR